jgi:hypothetical protein
VFVARRASAERRVGDVVGVRRRRVVGDRRQQQVGRAARDRAVELARVTLAPAERDRRNAHLAVDRLVGDGDRARDRAAVGLAIGRDERRAIPVRAVVDVAGAAGEMSATRSARLANGLLALTESKRRCRRTSVRVSGSIVGAVTSARLVTGRDCVVRSADQGRSCPRRIATLRNDELQRSFAT